MEVILAMSKAKERAKTIGLWVLQVLLAALFINVGVTKFTEPSWAERFTNWGYSDAFRLLIGTLETLGGLGLLIPRLAAYAAAGLIVIMIGASVTHIVHGESWQNWLFILLLGLVLYARRPPFLRRKAA